MRRRLLVAILAALALLISVAPPAGAGTEIKDNPTGLNTAYYDYHYTAAQRPMGFEHAIDVVEPSGSHRICRMRGVWGNLQAPDGFLDGFATLRWIAGNSCKWGGIRITYFDTRYNVVGYGPVKWCVASGQSTSYADCRQMADGRIIAGAGFGWNVRRSSPIIQAEFIVCSGDSFPWLIALVNCDHHYWKIDFG